MIADSTDALAFLRKSSTDPSTGWISDTDLLQAVQRVYADMNGSDTVLEQMIGLVQTAMETRVSNMEATVVTKIDGIMRTVNVVTLPAGSSPTASYDPVTGSLVLNLPAPAAGATGPTGAPGEALPVFASKGIVTAVDPRDLHDPLKFPRPDVTYSGAPWMYLVRYSAPSPLNPPTDGSYTVGAYYNNLISMWAWSPLTEVDPQDPSKDTLGYGDNSRPGLPGNFSSPWPAGVALPVFTRVGPWILLSDMSEVAQASVNTVLRGALWYTGHGLPTTIEGSRVGDHYLDLDTGNVYSQVS